MADDRFMRRALELAQPHRTHPNPRVGAVVVSPNGEVVGEGAHVGTGHAHAEVVALDAAGEAASRSTLYVNLEPCTHHGRTPPCVDAVISSGVSRVVVGMADPDSKVHGSGITKLREAGVEVVDGFLEDEAEAINEAYARHRRTGLPRVTVKYAMTLDGSAAAQDRTSQWITSTEAREDAHALRATMDAVVVGAGTLRADNPRLDVRLEGHDGAQPVPVIVSGREQLPDDAAVFDREPIVISTSERGVPSGKVIVVDGDDFPDPKATARALADQGLLDVLLEGGPTIAGEWWRAGIVTGGVVYMGAKVAGGSGIPPLGGLFPNIEDAEVVSIQETRSLGSDIRIDFVRR